MILLFFILSTVSHAESYFFQGKPTIRNGIYQTMISSETSIIVENNIVRLCGFADYENGSRGFFKQQWSLLGPYLYSGRERVGTFTENKLFIEKELPQEKKQILLIEWNNGTYIYSMKHPSLGGFQVEGIQMNKPTQDLIEACEQ